MKCALVEGFFFLFPLRIVHRASTFLLLIVLLIQSLVYVRATIRSSFTDLPGFAIVTGAQSGLERGALPRRTLEVAPFRLSHRLAETLHADTITRGPRPVHKA